MKLWKMAVLSVGVGLIVQVPARTIAFAGTRVYSAEAENEITTGDVAISVAEYEINKAGEEVKYQDGKCVLPGQKVSKIVRITNEAEDVWVRVKVEYDSDDLEMILTEEMLGGIDESWKKIGEYYYCMVPVPGGEMVDFFREIQIPAEWDSSVSEKEFSLIVTAQAIQEAHFTPDFSGEAPWFGVPIEACAHDDHTRKAASGDGAFEIVFENGTEGFVKDGSDFFEDFSSMLPGDTMTGTLEFGSRFGRNLNISFRTEIPEDQSEEALKLLQDLELSISDGNQILYEGNLEARSLAEGIQLIKGLKKNEKRTITYRIFMPEELDNASALQKAKVRWIFETEYLTGSGGGSGSGGSSGSGNSAGGPGVSSVLPGPIAEPVQKMEEAVQEFAEYLADLPGTGDARNGYLFLAMLISGSAAFLLSSGEEKRERKGEKTEHE